MVQRFAGRTAVITGGGGGIGAATARRFETDGAAVAVMDGDEGVLVNNAGLTHDHLLFKMSEQDSDIAIYVNLKGALLCTPAAQTRRLGQPKEVSSVIGLLSCGDVSCVSGQVIYINGGSR